MKQKSNEKKGEIDTPKKKDTQPTSKPFKSRIVDTTSENAGTGYIITGGVNPPTSDTKK